MVSGQLGQLLELGGVLVELSSFHLEFEEPFFSSLSTHDILEVLGEVIDHSVPDLFVCVSPSRTYVAVQLCGDFLDPEVHLRSPKISEEQHGPGHWIIHDPRLFVDPLVDVADDFGYVCLDKGKIRLVNVVDGSKHNAETSHAQRPKQ